MPNDLKHKIENGKPCNCKSFIDEKINLKPFKNDQRYNKHTKTHKVFGLHLCHPWAHGCCMCPKPTCNIFLGPMGGQ